MDWIRIATGIAALAAAAVLIVITCCRIRRCRNWVEVNARCIEAVRSRRAAGKSSSTTVRYSYGFPGKTAVSDEATVNASAHFSSGDDIPVLVNPVDADESTPVASLQAWRGYAAGGIVLAIAGTVLLVTGFLSA